MSTLRVGHLSGKWSADKHDVAGYIAHEVRSRNLDICTTTEAQQWFIVETVKDALGPGFGVVKRREYLVVYRKATVRRALRPTRILRLSNVRNFPQWRQLWVGVFWFRVRATGTLSKVMVGHMPAGVQSGRAWRTDSPLAVAASTQGSATWGRRIARLRSRRPNVLQIATMDSNLDQKDAHWRGWLSDQLHAASVWQGRVPHEGSHVDRLIDTAHVSGASTIDTGVSRAPRPAGYDHRGIWFTLRLKATGK